MEDVLGREGELPPERTSLSLVGAQICGAGSRAEEVALESVDRIRLCRATRIKSKSLLGPKVSSVASAVEYLRRVAKETGDRPVKASAQEREFIDRVLRILYTPYAPSVRGAGPPAIGPECMGAALGIFRTLSRIAKDAARAKSSFPRVFDACYGYSTK